MNLNFEHKKGDTFEAVPFEYLIDTVPLDLTDAVVRMQLRQQSGGTIFLAFTSVASDGITITDATAGKLKINKQIIDIKSANYLYDIEITLANGDVNTDVSGYFLITEDITR